MHIHEVVLNYVANGELSRLLVHDGAGDFVSSLVVTEKVTVLSVADETPQGKDAVLARAASPAAVAAAVTGLADGVVGFVVLETPVEQLPIGQLIDAVLSAGAQVHDLVPVDDPAASAVLVVACGDELAAPAAYLRGMADEGVPEAAATRRLVAEWVIESVVGRAREQAEAQAAYDARAQAVVLQQKLDTIEAEHNASVEQIQARLVQTKRRLDNVESSTALQLGRALVGVRRHPVSGSVVFVREVRAAARRRRSSHRN